MSDPAGHPMPPERKPVMDYVIPALVLVGTLVLAGHLYRQYLDVARLRWDGPVHDRNAHYLFGLSLAMDVQQGNVGQLLSDLDEARVWPPLHGILLAGVLLVGGPDHRLAVLPSLAGWVATVTFGFLLARRMAPWYGNLAGLAAAVLLVASPAHRAYATDIMLESLGAGLSLAVLYFYVAGVQDRSRWAWRALGVALTALFVHKYNYWLLVVLALLAAECSVRPWSFWHRAAEAIRGYDWRRWAGHQLHHPLNYFLLAALALMAVVWVSGGTNLRVAGRSISVRSIDNPLHLAYALLLLRVVLAWRQAGREWMARLGEPARQLTYWHAWPVALWFMLPKRLSYMVWFLSPANAGAKAGRSLGQSVEYYWSMLVRDYHPALVSALLVIGLLVVALVCTRRLKPGARVVLLFILIAVALSLRHPNQKSRYLHSWVAAGWVGAGAGLVLLAGRSRPGWGRLRPLLAVGGVAALALVHLPDSFQAGHAEERGLRSLRASTRDLTDAYLPLLDGSQRVAILGTMPFKQMAAWSYLERHARRDRPEADLYEAGWARSLSAETFEKWLRATPCDTIVYVDMPPGSYFFERTAENERCARIGQLLRSQSVFRLEHQQDFPQYRCNVTVWKREPSAAATRP